jgi:hypothetical protein
MTFSEKRVRIIASGVVHGEVQVPLGCADFALDRFLPRSLPLCFVLLSLDNAVRGEKHGLVTLGRLWLSPP